MSNLVPVPRELMDALERLAGLPDAVRQSLTDHLHATIPVTVSEHAYMASLAAGVPMYVRAQTGGLELITGICAVVPSGCTGLVQLGPLAIPVSAGLTQITPVKRELGTSDTRQITISGGSGPTLLWIWGDQQPTYGVMAH